MDFQTAAHFGQVRDIRFDPSGEYIFSLGEDDGCIFIWNSSDLTRSTNNGIENASKGSTVRAIGWTGNSNFVFAGENKKIIETNWKKCDKFNVIFESESTIDFFDIHGDAMACACDRKVVLLDRNTNGNRNIELDDIRWLSFSPDGEYLATEDKNDQVCIWELNGLNLIYKDVVQTKINPCWYSNKLFVFMGSKLEFNVLNVEKPNEMKSILINDLNEKIDMFLIWCSKLIIADNSHQISIYQINDDLSTSFIRRFSYNGEIITSLNCNKSLICAGDSDGNIYVWSLHEEEEIVEENKEMIEENTKNEKPKIDSDFSFLKDNPYYVEAPKKVVKKTKNKGKQQLLDVIHDKSKPKTKRQFLPDDSESSSFEENENIEDDLNNNESTLVESNKISYLSDNDDDSEQEEVKPKSFLDEEASDHSDINIDEDMDIEIPSDENLDSTPQKGEEILQKNEEVLDNKENNQLINEITTQFMPNSCDEIINSSKILCWNGYGSMILKYDDNGSQTIDITPSENFDFSSKRIEDLHNITVGTIDEYGYLFASKNNILYHCNEVFGANADVSLELPSLETVDLVASGSSWFAVATSLNRLYILTNTGLPMSSFSLESRCITMVGCENYLFIVFGSNLRFELFDIPERKLVSSGFLPVKSLKWTGFDLSTHSVLIEDSNFILLTLNHDYGIRWTSVLDLKKYFKENTTSFFIVNVEQHDLYGIKLTNDIKAPQIKPSSQLEEYHLEPLTFSYAQNKCMLSLLNYEESNNKAAAGKSLDRELIVLFSNALNDNKLLLATQIFKRLKSEKGREIALRYADQTGHSSVSERLIKIVENQDSESDIEFDENSPSPPPYERNETSDEEEEEEDVKEENTVTIHQEEKDNNESQDDVIEEESDIEKQTETKSKEKKRKEAPKSKNEPKDKRRIPAISRIKKTNDIAVLDKFGFSK